MTTIYKVRFEPIDIAVEDFEFLNDFIIDYRECFPRQTQYYVDEELLDETLLGWKELGKEPPAELVNFLREQINKEGDFTFTIG